MIEIVFHFYPDLPSISNKFIPWPFNCTQLVVFVMDLCARKILNIYASVQLECTIRWICYKTCSFYHQWSKSAKLTCAWCVMTCEWFSCTVSDCSSCVVLKKKSLIMLSHADCALMRASLPLTSLPKSCIHFCSSVHMCHMPHPSHSS